QALFRQSEVIIVSPSLLDNIPESVAVSARAALQREVATVATYSPVFRNAKNCLAATTRLQLI
ncbi:hypothetical protein, partial [Stutzerimonas nitrititolerans]|uniref:hypothetical protein n=1 Tax=Stutzerimonas nitrititolerans TaxID=2482751 RepID=UPI00289BCE0B